MVSECTDDAHIPPRGLSNPSNHCYVNSVLQVASRVLIGLNNDINFSKNYEGTLMKALIDSTNPMSNVYLNYVKSLFSRFHSFFNGSRQQDAHECLMLLFDIFHEGTKWSLLDVYDEESEISLKKQLFRFSIYHRFKCMECENESSHSAYKYFHTIDPRYKYRIVELIDHSFDSKLYKMCNYCHKNTLHKEKGNFEHLPKVLTIMVNRFDTTNRRRKINTPIILEQQIKLNTSSYSLIASIHHHNHDGSSTSGHYTSTIFYPSVIYHCNDNHIKICNYKEMSDDVYVALYACDD